MILQKIDVERELTRAKIKDKGSEKIIQDVYMFLKKDREHLERIEENLVTGGGVAMNKFTFELLETGNIYHVDQIRSICIDYRLRFLDSKYFKGEIPPEGISKIKSLEKLHQVELKGFKIVAPSKLFRLKNLDDPLLFAPIGNNYYYLIHKWGNDLHPLRKILMWPFRNVQNLIALLIVLSFVSSLLVPEGLFSKKVSNGEFWIVFFFMFKSIAAVTIFYGFALGKNFNPAIWNSNYFNS